MKKLILNLIGVFLTSVTFAQGNWVLKSTPLTGTPPKYVEKFEIKRKDLIWGHCRAFTATNRIRTVVRSVDEGNTWKVRTVGGVVSNLEIANVSGVDSNISFASLYPPTATLTNQGIYRTLNGGVNWTNRTVGKFGGASFVNWVHFWDGAHGLAMGDAVGGYFEIYITNDTANTWTRVPNTGLTLTPFNAGEYGIVNLFAPAGDSVIYFGTQYGRVLKSSDYGLTWTNSTSPFFDSTVTTTQAFTQMEFKNKMEGILVTTKGVAGSGVDSVRIAKTIDGGVTWNVTNYGGANWWSPSHTSYVPGTSKIVTSGGSLVSVAAAGNGTPARGTTISYDNGVNFEVLDSSQFNYTVQFFDDSTGYASGEVSTVSNNGVFKWENGSVFTKVKTIVSAVINEVSIYPNPTSSIVTIRVPSKRTQVTLYNILGEQILSSEVNDGKMYIDMSTYNQGTYIVQMVSGNNKTTRKLVKQ